MWRWSNRPGSMGRRSSHWCSAVFLTLPVLASGTRARGRRPLPHRGGFPDSRPSLAQRQARLPRARGSAVGTTLIVMRVSLWPVRRRRTTGRSACWSPGRWCLLSAIVRRFMVSTWGRAVPHRIAYRDASQSCEPNRECVIDRALCRLCGHGGGRRYDRGSSLARHARELRRANQLLARTPSTAGGPPDAGRRRRTPLFTPSVAARQDHLHLRRAACRTTQAREALAASAADAADRLAARALGEHLLTLGHTQGALEYYDLPGAAGPEAGGEPEGSGCHHLLMAHVEYWGMASCRRCWASACFGPQRTTWAPLTPAPTTAAPSAAADAPCVGPRQDQHRTARLP
jgi:hypothetical protein